MTTEKMLPAGFMPGKNQIEEYREMYKDPDFSLRSRIESFDSGVLSDDNVLAFCSRYPLYTGVEKDGTEGIGWKDTQHSLSLMKISFSRSMDELQSRESRFRFDGSENNFKTLRSAFSTAIGKKICVDYLETKVSSMSEADREEERKLIQQKNDDWNQKQKRRNKISEIAMGDPEFISHLEDYNLTEEELDELDEMYVESYVPKGYIREWTLTRRDYVIPVQSVKLRMIRKGMGLNQREFAKLIGMNINKYAKLEQGKLDELGLDIAAAFTPDFIRSVAEATNADPFWLDDPDEYTLDDGVFFAEDDDIRVWWINKRYPEKVKGMKQELKNVTSPGPDTIALIGVKTDEDYLVLRAAVQEHIMDLQERIGIQLIRDVLDGKFTEDDLDAMPLFREDNTLYNVPPEVMVWMQFMAWLNEGADPDRWNMW